MTREQAFSKCPADSYVEYYGEEWLIVPYEPVKQPEFFVCHPGSQGTRTKSAAAAA
jgi:roadblock/LC7 domain-containing protein